MWSRTHRIKKNKDTILTQLKIIRNNICNRETIFAIDFSEQNTRHYNNNRERISVKIEKRRKHCYI